MRAATVARTLSRPALRLCTARGGYSGLLQGAHRAFSTTLRSHEKLYAKSHEWVEFSADKKTATIGVSAYAAKALGDVVFVELPTVDAEIVAGDSFGAVESVKSASELYVPVSGRVTEANRALEEKPSMMNKDPEGEAWIARISVAEDTGTATEELMDEAAYREFTDTETA